MVFCVVFFLVLGVDMLFGLVPFKTCPLFALMFVSPLFLCLFGLFADDVFSLSFSLRCWGNPNPFRVWVSPCVSSSWPRSPSSIRTSSPTPTPRFRTRSCVFSFSRRRSRWVVVGVWFLGWGLGSVGVFGLVCWSVLVARLFALAFLHLFLHSGNSDAGIPAAMAPDPLPAADWIVLGYPSPAGSRPWDGPICGGLGVQAPL